MSAPIGLRTGTSLPPAVQAFGQVAATFDERFGGWLSVAAQRRAVRRQLERAFRRGDSVLELGGGTGEDALYLAQRGVRVLLTDGSPDMVFRAAEKVRRAGLAGAIATRQLVLEELDAFVDEWTGAGRPCLDGAFSNFAALNCVADLASVARGLAALLRPGAPAVLVVFGTFPAGEILLHLLKGDPATAFRRLARGDVPARLAGRGFTVRYPGSRTIAAAFAPYFRLVRRRGIGIFVPPSAAEPVVSRWPGLLRLLERLDRVAAAPLALLGDHLLLQFARTEAPI
ncbi:MAG: methyltransferase domain-containing protein [Gemmatimonadetes bacterium]|nr:methyltransferase domain-containing protein [Gemmatimonadota bacterium]